ncbi:DeoR/GlpR family DNA-binding transcription regulator [Bacillus sp. FJAT-45350]|uniref:DeoR/GlpR family DNA-binding transcription regulator n=1 Tax=Bacillus sp. FJAT-45350 TaxID=2011014 RepID=UPI000BB6AC93|nr:DeoR/GlpR family DNA-binding transcription regulator [Bacillus sp. FJAT-45350]
MSISFEKRKDIIMDIIHKDDRVRIIDLIKVLGVSGETVRRDLDRMEKENLLKKVHGGAVREKGGSQEAPFDKKSMVKSEEKQMICKAAAELVEDGDIIFIGHGTTPLEMVHYLKEKKGVIIITPSMPILLLCLEVFEGRVIFTGGELVREQKLTAGPIAENVIGELKANKAFIAAGGISAKSGVTDYDLYGATLSRKMMERADEVIVLADNTKFGKTTFAHIASLSEISIVVSDSGFPKEWEKILDSFEVNTVVG